MAKRFNIRQSLVFHDYYSRLKNLALSVFEWTGLPSTCRERFLEDCLFHYGQAVFVNDPEMSFLNLKVTPASTLNVYNEPLAYTCYSTGYNKIFNADECVFIRNNNMEKSTDSTIILFAERLAKIELAMEVNINAQKTPVLIRCDEKTRTSLEAIYNQYEGDRPVIFGSKSLQDKPLETLKTDAPFVADRLREEKRAVWNEALEFLGLNTNPSDKKKERLVVNEVDANNEQIEAQANTMLLTRQDACRRIHEMFPELNVSVKMRTDKLEKAYIQKEGETHGEVHD